MTCPHCRTANPRSSDVCVECGAPLDPIEEKSQLSLPFAPVPPEIPLGSDSALPHRLQSYNRELHTSSPATRTRHRFQWSVPMVACVLCLAALAGRALHQLRNSRTSSKSSVFTPSVEASTPSVESTSKAQAAEKVAFEAKGHRGDEMFRLNGIGPSKLRRANANYVPFPNYTPSAYKLRLQYSNHIFGSEPTQLSDSYWRWKWRQGEDASNIDRFMEFYAPSAEIFIAPGKKIEVSELRSLIVEMRLSGFFTSVLDQTPPKWAQNTKTDHFELLAFHAYSDDSNNRLWGQRRMIWQKQGDQWLIIRDEFPPCYFNKDGK